MSTLFPNTLNENICVAELSSMYLKSHSHLFRPSTIQLHNVVQKLIESETFGKQPIAQIKINDVKMWFLKLQQDGKTYNTLHNVRGVLRPAFQMALEADIIVMNPFDFPLSSICSIHHAKRQAYDEAQRDFFLDFVKNSPQYSKYYDGIFILFHTGIRISEFCALSEADINLQDKILKIDKQLLRLGNNHYYIQNTKTTSGTREIPISPETAAAFSRLINREKQNKYQPSVCGYQGFFYIDSHGNPTVAQHWEGYFKNIYQKIEETHPDFSCPPITPHICRHSYCSILAAKGITPKHLQYLMGHSNISITMDIYTHVNLNNIQNELSSIGF